MQKRRSAVNKEIVDAGLYKLHGEQAEDQYRSAADRLETEFERLSREESAVVQEIRDVLQALSLADKRKWPRGVPQKRDPFSGPALVNAPRVVQPGPPQPARAGTLIEIDLARTAHRNPLDRGAR